MKGRCYSGRGDIIKWAVPNYLRCRTELLSFGCAWIPRMAPQFVQKCVKQIPKLKGMQARGFNFSHWLKKTFAFAYDFRQRGDPGCRGMPWQTSTSCKEISGMDQLGMPVLFFCLTAVWPTTEMEINKHSSCGWKNVLCVIWGIAQNHVLWVDANPVAKKLFLYHSAVCSWLVIAVF